MTRPFRFGVQRLEYGDPREIAAFARRAEELGYDELFSYDHIGAEDPFAPLLVAAGATEALRVGPLVLNNELHHPVLIARTAATVDRMSGGRLVLGLGAGYTQSEHDAIDVPLRPPGERVDRLAESVVVIRSLLDEGAVTFSGAHHHVALDDLGTPPTQPHVPLLIGGHGRRMVELAARHADIFQFTGLTHGDGGALQPGGFDIAAVDERARWLTTTAGGRDTDIERSALVQFAAVGDDAPDTSELAARFGLDAATIEASPFVLTGRAPRIVGKLERLRERIGVSHVVIRDPEGFAPIVDALRGR
ncbi:MAG: TIGR03621 family F420-dependent LLM class oxidoreductase [Actinobacteria bacterium]|nr:TIGR03621 family F420-dependent LLM class oxidoreductase [Actinomycetota bacterium]